MCCEDALGMKGTGELFVVPRASPAGGQATQRRNLLKGRWKKTEHFGTRIACRN